SDLVTKNALIFGNFSITWSGLNKTLFVAQIDVTVTSPAIKGGSVKVPLASGEIESLLASSSQTITATTGPVTINSNDSSRTGLYPPCQLAIGGITLADSTTTSFVATVDIELIGSATDASGNVERVEEKITVRAEY
ncbi:MAG: hypothetical protein V4760_01510, partial [Bdellovibrionota bacterium]